MTHKLHKYVPPFTLHFNAEMPQIQRKTFLKDLYYILMFLAKVQLREDNAPMSSSWPGLKPMTFGSCQNISCHRDSSDHRTSSNSQGLLTEFPTVLCCFSFPNLLHNTTIQQTIKSPQWVMFFSPMSTVCLYLHRESKDNQAWNKETKRYDKWNPHCSSYG